MEPFGKVLLAQMMGQPQLRQPLGKYVHFSVLLPLYSTPPVVRNYSKRVGSYKGKAPHVSGCCQTHGGMLFVQLKAAARQNEPSYPLGISY